MDSSISYQFMELAIQEAERGKTPFGCIIVQDGKAISRAFNTVPSSYDVSAHGEINAIRSASKYLQNHLLPKTTLYTTGEPCPMCISAIVYAQIPKVVYGASINTISRYMSQISISSQEVVAYSSRKVKLIGPFMEEKCIPLLERYS